MLDDLTVTRRRFSEWSDDAVLAVVAAEEGEYLAEVVEIARQEALRRGIAVEDSVSEIRHTREISFVRRSRILGYVFIYCGYSVIILALGTFADPAFFSVSFSPIMRFLTLLFLPAGAALIRVGAPRVASWRRGVFWSAAISLAWQALFLPIWLAFFASSRLEPTPLMVMLALSAITAWWFRAERRASARSAG